MQIHIARDGKSMGPFSLEEVNRQVAAGTLTLSDQAWYEGAAGWAPLSTVPGVTDSPQPASNTPGSAPPMAAAPGTPLPATPAVGGAAPIVPAPAAPTEPLAIWSLVLSLISFCGFCCTPVVLTGIGGVICGHLALSKIKANSGLQGHGLAVAGLVIGYFTIIGWLFWVLFFGGLAVMQGILESFGK